MSRRNDIGRAANAPISAVIVTFNSKDVIAQSLQALQSCSSVSQIIVVDNASTDGTATLVAKQFPQVEIVFSAENLGFGPGNNLGLQRVTNEFALLLNPDAIVTDEAVTTMLQVAAEQANAAIVGPLLQRPEKRRRTVRTGTVWDPQKVCVAADSDVEVEFLSGAAMLMRMSSITRSGLFDPNIFLFYEDDDLCRSARRAGYSLILTSKATVSHLLGLSTRLCPDVAAFKQYHFAWSRLYFESKEHGHHAAVTLARKTLRKLLRKTIVARLTRDQHKLKLLAARVHGVKCYLSGRMPSTVPHDFVNRMNDPSNDVSGIVSSERSMDMSNQRLKSRHLPKSA